MERIKIGLGLEDAVLSAEFQSGGKRVYGFAEKACPKCGIVKLRSEYYQNSRGWVTCANCKSCEQAKRKANGAQNHRDVLHKHDWWLRSNYGIALKDYYAMLERQGGKCAVCHRESNSRGRRWFDVDHDHKTGKVRGLLCSECNHGMGAMKDSIPLLRRAITYLENNG